MKDNVVKDKSLEFAVRIVNLYKFLVNEQKEFVMSKQILRSGTSIGANIREAEQAQSRADFINKLNIALKEANETEYWLELLIRTEYITREQYESINNDSTEINKLLKQQKTINNNPQLPFDFRHSLIVNCQLSIVNSINYE